MGTIYKKQRPDLVIWRLKIQCRQVSLNLVLLTSILNPSKANPNMPFLQSKWKLQQNPMKSTVTFILFWFFISFLKNFKTINFVLRTFESKGGACLSSQYSEVNHLNLDSSRWAWATWKQPCLVFFLFFFYEKKEEKENNVIGISFGEKTKPGRQKFMPTLNPANL